MKWNKTERKALCQINFPSTNIFLFLFLNTNDMLPSSLAFMKVHNSVWNFSRIKWITSFILDVEFERKSFCPKWNAMSFDVHTEKEKNNRSQIKRFTCVNKIFYVNNSEIWHTTKKKKERILIRCCVSTDLLVIPSV